MIETFAHFQIFDICHLPVMTPEALLPVRCSSSLMTIYVPIYASFRNAKFREVLNRKVFLFLFVHLSDFANKLSELLSLDLRSTGRSIGAITLCGQKSKWD